MFGAIPLLVLRYPACMSLSLPVGVIRVKVGPSFDEVETPRATSVPSGLPVSAVENRVNRWPSLLDRCAAVANNELR